MFKKSIAIAIVTIVISLFSVNSFAQRPTPGQMGGLLGVGGSSSGTASATGSADFVFQSNGQLYGTAYAYNGSHFEIYARDGSVLKTYANGCKPTTPSNGVDGLMCSFGHFNSNGRLIYSGWALVYANGFVYLRWMYDFTSGFQQNMDTGWVGLMPKS